MTKARKKAICFTVSADLEERFVLFLDVVIYVVAFWAQRYENSINLEISRIKNSENIFPKKDAESLG
jgi:hypothetical protein